MDLLLLTRRRAQKREGPPATGFVGFGDPDYGNLAAGRERGSGKAEEEFQKFEPERGGVSITRPKS